MSSLEVRVFLVLDFLDCPIGTSENLLEIGDEFSAGGVDRRLMSPWYGKQLTALIRRDSGIDLWIEAVGNPMISKFVLYKVNGYTCL
jgi:hypothetical protein